MTYGEHEFNHVFDGSALLQRFTFGETGATFCSRFLKSYAYTTNLENEQIVVSEFGTTGKSLSKSKLGKCVTRRCESVKFHLILCKNVF